MSGDELDIKQLFSYKKNYKRGAAYLFGKSQMKKTVLTGREGQKANLGQLLQNSAEQHGPKAFVTQAETGECLTYRVKVQTSFHL